MYGVKNDNFGAVVKKAKSKYAHILKGQNLACSDR